MRTTLTLTLVLASLCAPAALLAFDAGEPKTRIVVAGSDDDTQIEREIEETIVEELAHARTPVELIFEDVSSINRHDVRWIVRVTELHSNTESGGGFGIGAEHAGADIEMVRSVVIARVDLIDPASLETVRTFEIEESAVRPRVSAIGIGGRFGAYIRLPSRVGTGAARSSASEAIGERIAEALITNRFPDQEL